MTEAFRVVVYAVGALALLVVVNWARHELVVGLVAACLVVVAAALASRRKEVREKEGTPPEGETL